MKHRARAALLAAWITATSVSCGFLPFPSAPDECGFPDGTTLAFAGRVTLSELGLGEGDTTADVPAMVYVTAEPVPFNGEVPVGGQVPPDQPLYCALYDDGVAWGSLPDGWIPPGS